jgi:hypothetical protein
MVSFAGSTGASRTAAAAAAVAGSSTESISITDGAGIGSPSEMQRPCSIVRGSGPTVSFAGSAGAGADASGGDTLSAMGASSPGSRGALLSKADRVAGNASSIAVGSEYRGRGAQSVTGSQVAGSGGGRPAATAASGPASDCLSLHGVLVLCKEVGATSTRLCSAAATNALLTSSKRQKHNKQLAQLQIIFGWDWSVSQASQTGLIQCLLR